jgi:hypothetical protein
MLRRTGGVTWNSPGGDFDAGSTSSPVTSRIVSSSLFRPTWKVNCPPRVGDRRGQGRRPKGDRRTGVLSELNFGRDTRGPVLMRPRTALKGHQGKRGELVTPGGRSTASRPVHQVGELALRPFDWEVSSRRRRRRSCSRRVRDLGTLVWSNISYDPNNNLLSTVAQQGSGRAPRGHGDVPRSTSTPISPSRSARLPAPLPGRQTRTLPRLRQPACLPRRAPIMPTTASCTEFGRSATRHNPALGIEAFHPPTMARMRHP